MYFKGSSAAVCVFDTTNIDTFNSLELWIKEIDQNSLENMHLLILGNKCDMPEREEVPVDKVMEYAKLKSATFHYVSAKDDIGITEAFNELS